MTDRRQQVTSGVLEPPPAMRPRAAQPGPARPGPGIRPSPKGFFRGKSTSLSSPPSSATPVFTESHGSLAGPRQIRGGNQIP